MPLGVTDVFVVYNRVDIIHYAKLPAIGVDARSSNASHEMHCHAFSAVSTFVLFERQAYSSRLQSPLVLASMPWSWVAQRPPRRTAFSSCAAHPTLKIQTQSISHRPVHTA